MDDALSIRGTAAAGGLAGGLAFAEPAVEPASTWSARLVQRLAEAGYTHATGVPCSLLSGLFAQLERRAAPLQYVPAPREDSAIGVATGLLLAGRRPVILMQNSGLGYSLNVITSLNHIYDLGIPIVVSWRGRHVDAVEHEIIGREVTHLLDVFGIAWTIFEPERADETINEFLAAATEGTRMNVLLVSEGMGR